MATERVAWIYGMNPPYRGRSNKPSPSPKASRGLSTSTGIHRQPSQAAATAAPNDNSSKVALSSSPVAASPPPPVSSCTLALTNSPAWWMPALVLSVGMLGSMSRAETLK